jgi:hypothetical protein
MGSSADSGSFAPARASGGQALLAQKPPLGNNSRLLDLNKKAPPSMPPHHQTATPAANPRPPIDA